MRVLTPGGRFLIDLMNPGPALAGLQAARRRRRSTAAAGPRSSAGTTPPTSRINKRIAVSGPGEPTRTFCESVRLYQPDEVTIGLRWAGLEVASLFGNFQGDSYERDSERLILLGHKPA